MADHDPLFELRKLLDPRSWPRAVREGEYLIIEGEVFAFVTDHPLEERIRKVLYR